MKKRLIWALILAVIAVSFVVIRFRLQYDDYIDLAGRSTLGLDTYNEAKARGGLIADYRVSYVGDGVSEREIGKCYLHRGTLKEGMSCIYTEDYFISIENLEKSPIYYVINESDTLKERADKMRGFSFHSTDRVPKNIVALDKDGNVLVSYTLDSTYAKNIEAPLEPKYWEWLVYIWNY